MAGASAAAGLGIAAGKVFGGGAAVGGAGAASAGGFAGFPFVFVIPQPVLDMFSGQEVA